VDEVAAKQLFAKTGITLGETLGDRYQIVEVLGQGGMGTVFKAINLSLNKPVAVKALHMYLDKFAAMRFQQEIKSDEHALSPAFDQRSRCGHHCRWHSVFCHGVSGRATIGRLAKGPGRHA